MAEIADILNATTHRPFQLPAKPWSYYQEWNDVLFLHWQIPYAIIRPLVPQELDIDNIEGKCYISLVAFTMQKIRPAYLPSLSWISNFHEINVRTYVEKDGKKGVYFLNIEAEKELSVLIAKKLTNLPYEKSLIKHSQNNYHSVNSVHKFNLDVQFNLQDAITTKTSLDIWLTERYCLYLSKYNQLYRYQVHHKEWELKSVAIQQLNLQYKFGGYNLNNNNFETAHYSNGVQVIAWNRERL